MRTFCAALIASMLLLLPLAPAMADGVERGIALDLADANHKAVVYAALELADEEALAFWPVFDVYLASLRQLRAQTMDLITKYADSAGRVEDDLAQELIDSFFDIERETLDLRLGFNENLAGILPPLKVMRAMQIETKVLATERFQITRAVPLVPQL